MSPGGTSNPTTWVSHLPLQPSRVPLPSPSPRLTWMAAWPSHTSWWTWRRRLRRQNLHTLRAKRPRKPTSFWRASTKTFLGSKPLPLPCPKRMTMMRGTALRQSTETANAWRQNWLCRPGGVTPMTPAGVPSRVWCVHLSSFSLWWPSFAWPIGSTFTKAGSKDQSLQQNQTKRAKSCIGCFDQIDTLTCDLTVCNPRCPMPW